MAFLSTILQSSTHRFTFIVFMAMVLGIAAGTVGHQVLTEAADIQRWSEYLSLVTEIFLRLIKMIIAPLVFSTLVVGIAHMEDTAAIGRVGLKTMLWFVSASLLSLTVGLIMVHLLSPGVGLNLPIPAVTANAPVQAAALSLHEFVLHLVPRSIVEALAGNELLQIVVFSIFFGTAVAALGERARAVIVFAEQIALVMLKITGYVMKFAPLAVFAAVASTVLAQGLIILVSYAKFIGSFYLGLAVLWTLLVSAGTVVVGPRLLRLMRNIREPIVIAFSTASSEAAYPKTLESLESFGVARRISSFVLPLGYSFNLDGSMMYCTFATLFIAQAYGIELSLGQQITMLLLLMITSKGMAGVPRASLVVIAATLAYFKIPEAGLLLILAVDHLLDMGRSATNVVGNSVAAAVIAKMENQLADGAAEPEISKA
jgi:Na+/H+-dicarboxylate symporter